MANTSGLSTARYSSVGAASIPSRRSLNVQLGPAATDAADTDLDGDSGQGNGVETDTLESQRQRELHHPYHQHPSHSVAYRRHRPHQQSQHQQQQQQRLRWNRMAAPPPPRLLEPSLPCPVAPSSSLASACQLVDFGETRDLIRRQREAAKRSAEVSSILGHLSLDEDEVLVNQAQADSWATFRQQPDSQFKQYVFQSPGRLPRLPSNSAPHHPPQRSRTTLGSGLLGNAGGALHRERTSVTLWGPSGARQGYTGTPPVLFNTSSPYDQFARTGKSKSFWLG